MNQPDDKWIDAAAQLPPLDLDSSWHDNGDGCDQSVTVIVQTNSGRITIGYTSKYDDGDMEWLQEGRDAYIIGSGVAYWQPLPEPRVP